MTTRKVNFYYWLVRKLPKKVRYFVAQDVLCHSTTGKYHGTITTDIPAIEAISRFAKDHNIHGCNT